MSRVDQVRALLDTMTEAERRQVATYVRQLLPRHAVEEQMMISAEGMLEAFARAGDFTVRMVRGIFAEAAFASDVLPSLEGRWRQVDLPSGDPPFDFLLTDDVEHAASSADSRVRLQVKMQRSSKKVPLLASQVWKTSVKWPANYFVVEVQKSRKGEKSGESTRPYRFGEFDLLAVSLGPSRGNWGVFVYTVAAWLLPDPADSKCILKYQPVAPLDSLCWTSSFDTAVSWFRSGDLRRIDADWAYRFRSA